MRVGGSSQRAGGMESFLVPERGVHQGARQIRSSLTEGEDDMEISNAYVPGAVFAPAGAGAAPRCFIAPQRYIQGNGVLAHLGRYLSLVRAHRVAILISAGGEKRHGALVSDSLRRAGIDSVVCIFGGECSRPEIEQQVAALAAREVDCVVAVGGGKCVDAGKAVAFRLDVPVVIAPTLASNDAPCSALSVLYTPAGVSEAVEFYPSTRSSSSTPASSPPLRSAFSSPAWETRWPPGTRPRCVRATKRR
jgi:hypothetical protein